MLKYSFQNGSPSSSNVDKLGVYLLFSLFFVVATMLEFAIVLLLKRNPKIPKMSQLMTNFYAMLGMDKTSEFHRNKGTKIQDLEDRNDNIGRRKDLNALAAYILIDLIASFLFPISYLLFNIIYWYIVL